MDGDLKSRAEDLKKDAEIVMGGAGMMMPFGIRSLIRDMLTLLSDMAEAIEKGAGDEK
jgi:hypothetical protein